MYVVPYFGIRLKPLEIFLLPEAAIQCVILVTLCYSSVVWPSRMTRVQFTTISIHLTQVNNHLYAQAPYLILPYYFARVVSWEWKYVGEAGEEITARNSHSLSVVSVPRPGSDCTCDKYLVVYGGASPELGPLGDTYYALLPAEGISGGGSLTLIWCY